MTNKELYKEFCEKEPIPIFSQYWWLDNVCGPNNWDVIVIKKGDDIWASMPYFFINKLNFTLITMPQLTQNMGVYIKYPKNQKQFKKLSWEKEMMNDIISKIPKFDSFTCNFYHKFTNGLPFYWNNYSLNTNYTYIIDNLEDIENVFNNFDPSYRNKIRKASKIVSIRKGMEIEKFYEINKMTFSRQSIDIPYSLDFLRKHDKILSSKNAREIFYAVDEKENIHSALYLTWDNNSSYVHMVGENPNLRKSAAGILLIWEAINYTKKHLKLNQFDFEGSMIENVEQVRRSFGAKQVPYLSINRIDSKILKIKNHIRDILR